MSEPVKIAMLGSDRGRVLHAGTDKREWAAGGPELLAHAETREGVRKAVDDPESANDLDRLIARDDIDLFIVALPNQEHLPVSLALLESKRIRSAQSRSPEIETKPNRCTLPPVKSGAMHGYAETEVFAPGRREGARNDRSAEGCGRVIWVRSRESHSGPHSPHFWDIEQTGGGALNDLGCHCVEAAAIFLRQAGQSRRSDGVGRHAGPQGSHKRRGQRAAGSEIRKRRHRSLRACPGRRRAAWTCEMKIHGSEGIDLHGCDPRDTDAILHSKACWIRIEKADLSFGWTRPLA